MKKNILFALFFFLNLNLILNLVSCSTTDPKLEPDLKLELKDVSCTEAWLQLTTNNIQIPVTINLLKNNSVTQTFSLSTQDSLLYIDSLLPNKNYSFQVSSIQNPASSNKVTATTLDTTSHNFTWQTFTFGDLGAGSSLLYDVAIIDENNIWVVGEIYMNDSLGNPNPVLYNLIKWNGTEWKPERVYYNYQGSDFIAPIHSIFGFTLNDVWIGSNQPMRWNGNIWEKWDLLGNIWNGWINKIWGNNSNDIYIVGNSGSIAHYNGSRWTKIESGTTLNLTSISGNIAEVYFSGVNSFTNEGILLKYKSSTISNIANGKIIGAGEVFNPFLYGEFQTVCLMDNTLLLGGNFLYQFKFNRWNYVKSLPENFVNGNPNGSIRGFIYSITANNENDIIISGDRNTLLHFNGIDWLQLGEPYNPLSNTIHRSTKIQNNIVVTVGFKGNKAMITKLVR